MNDIVLLVFALLYTLVLVISLIQAILIIWKAFRNNPITNMMVWRVVSTLGLSMAIAIISQDPRMTKNLVETGVTVLLWLGVWQMARSWYMNQA